MFLVVVDQRFDCPLRRVCCCFKSDFFFVFVFFFCFCVKEPSTSSKVSQFSLFSILFSSQIFVGNRSGKFQHVSMRASLFLVFSPM